MTYSMTPDPHFHEDSGAVRFWVRTADGASVGAMIRKEVLQFRFHAAPGEPNALNIYVKHQAEIDAAALRRIAAGSIEPVILRETDFR